MKKVHFIAIGGSAMHNLAIALNKKGYVVSGSDDEIFDPAASRLEKYGLLPKNIGWNSNNITKDIDEIILGMHARIDNPELLKAQELGIKIYSYPEYLYEQSKDKIRVVIGGSHGKTSVTSMILHVLQNLNINCDYMVGAQLEGFEVMVKLSEDAELMIIEGDEYLTSPIDRRPKFHLYKANIAVINGIAWDHINVFPTFENYVEQFRIFTDTICENGILCYFDKDENINSIIPKLRKDISAIPYSYPEYSIKNNSTYINFNGKEYQLMVFGKHNLQNINAAWKVCKTLNIDEEDFIKAVCSFKGASKRLELVHHTENYAFFKDFAHSPSKLRATVEAVKEQFKDRKLIACMELHTFSSLNAEFLNQYEYCLEKADIAIVYYNPEAIKHKKLENLSKDTVFKAFKQDGLLVFDDSVELLSYLNTINYNSSNILWLTSGNFNGIDEIALASALAS